VILELEAALASATKIPPPVPALLPEIWQPVTEAPVPAAAQRRAVRQDGLRRGAHLDPGEIFSYRGE